MITGPTGKGKTFLIAAIGNQGCLHGYNVLYANTMHLLMQLKMAKAYGSSFKKLIKTEKQNLLILDDFGPLDQGSRAPLLEIIEDPHSQRSTIIISQLSVNSGTM